jgi:hypothetical protein
VRSGGKASRRQSAAALVKVLLANCVEGVQSVAKWEDVVAVCDAVSFGTRMCSKYSGLFCHLYSCGRTTMSSESVCCVDGVQSVAKLEDVLTVYDAV